MARREELSRFLKAARGRIEPERVGLPAGERRRVPGLRREEVAALAGMSITWYTWFEQGREVQLSASMLERLSSALALDMQEREYLFTLAQHRPPPLTLEPDDTIHPSTQQMLDSVGIPALVITDYWLVVGWNELVTVLFRDYGQLSAEQRNLFRILLTGEYYRRDPEQYRDIVRRLTARLKWDYSRAKHPEYFEALIAEMSEISEVFAECWKDAEVVSHFEGPNSVEFVGVGKISFLHTSYAVERSPSQRLVLFVPMTVEDAEKMARVAAI